ncbi:protein mono-ADP-ribosyltransferase PARP14-like [Mytilus californianus]|uniref:protein mono-ADP-ribosyltransferase PARP14-like n=1 Tax=Mytilus californianus TaxID=6549 RepID=UPI002246B946|nr:protein mono-ADP-ribosyltransferase PARP14-like [Mytilus californianus]
MHYEGFQQRCKSRCTKPSNNPDYGKEEEAKSDTACEAQVAVGMFRIPEPIIIQSIDHRKIEFIMKSPAEKASFEFLLLSYHARVKWPELTEMNCTLEIISTLAKHFKNCTSLSKTWTTTVSKQTETFFDMLCVNELSISQEIWDNVEKHLPSGNEHVIVRAIKKFRKVSIVGHKIEANEITMLIEDIIENFKIVVNKRKCEGFEEIDVQEYQLYILNYSQFAVDMQSQYNDLAVTLDFKKFKVIFTGTTEKIVEAKVKMFEILGKIKCDLRGEFCDQFIQYLSIQEVDEFVRTQFYKKGAFGAWEFQKGNAIGMYSFSGHEAGVAFDMLLTSIVNEQLYISNSKCVALDSEQWLNEQKTIRRIHQKALIEIYIVNGLSDRNVSIYSISARAARSVHGEIKKFFSQYTPLNFPINPTKTWKEDENIKPTENTWKIEKYLQPTANTWTADRYIKPTAKRWKEGGYIKPTTRTWKKDKYIKPIAKTWLTRTGQSIYTLVGDITCLDVDVIVNSVNKNHQLKQGLARLMVDKGGDIIRRECNDYIRRNGTLEEGDVMWTSAGDLPCKWILHAVSPVWKNGRSNEFGNLYDCIWQSFGKAYRRECSSIAIPALSTGISGFPANRSTDTIVKAIHDYMKKNGHYTSIQQVYLCDINTDTIDHFESALDLYFPYTLLTDYQHDLFHSDI